MKLLDLHRVPPAPRVIDVGESNGPSPYGWHAVSDYLRCPKEFQFRHVRKIILPTSETPDNLAVGILLHAAKAEWFARNFSTTEATLAHIRELVRTTSEKQPLPVREQALANALRYWEEYIAHWRVRPRPKPVACELLLGPAPLEKGDSKTLWRTGRLDDVSYYPEAGGHLAIGDLKTTAGTLQDALNEYSLHGQPLLYSILWKRAPQGEAKHGPIRGVVLDILQKGYGGKPSKFARALIPISTFAQRWFSRDLRVSLLAVAGVTPITSAARNITACTRMLGRGRRKCDYHPICSYGRSAGGEYLTADGQRLDELDFNWWE